MFELDWFNPQPQIIHNSSHPVAGLQACATKPDDIFSILAVVMVTVMGRGVTEHQLTC